MYRRLITHDGNFHADDVLATVIITCVYPGIEVVRTRDLSGVTDNDILVDVGHEYDEERNRFDHHQKDFDLKWENSRVPLASAGLVWATYGTQYIKNRFSIYVSDDVISRVYHNFIREIDGRDNGCDVAGRGSLIRTDISRIISKIDTFYNAVKHMQTTFDIVIGNMVLKDVEYAIESDYIKKCINERTQDGIVIMHKKIKQWRRGIREFEQENMSDITFVVRPDDKEGYYKLNALVSEWPSVRCPILPIEAVRQLSPKVVPYISFIHKHQFVGVFTNHKAAIFVGELSINNIQ